MKISDAWILYEKDKRYLNYSPATLKAYKLQLSLLERYLNDADLGDVTREQLKEYLQSLTHLKPSSLGHRVRFVKSFFRWAVDEGHLNKNPAVALKEPNINTRIPKFLNEEDTESIREACQTSLEHSIIEFLYTTGCRIGEAVKANITDIDWDKKCLIVDGKGRKEREVYFNMKCFVWLRRYLAERKDSDPALFVTQRAPHRMTTWEMRYIVKRISGRSGVAANVYPHRLRHSFATHMLNNGAPMEAIQQMLGHSKSETTQLYAALSGERRREIYKRYF